MRVVIRSETFVQSFFKLCSQLGPGCSFVWHLFIQEPEMEVIPTGAVTGHAREL